MKTYAVLAFLFCGCGGALTLGSKNTDGGGVDGAGGDLATNSDGGADSCTASGGQCVAPSANSCPNGHIGPEGCPGQDECCLPGSPCTDDSQCKSGEYCAGFTFTCIGPSNQPNNLFANETGSCHVNCSVTGCGCQSDADCGPPPNGCDQGTCHGAGVDCQIPTCPDSCPSTKVSDLACPICLCASCPACSLTSSPVSCTSDSACASQGGYCSTWDVGYCACDAPLCTPGQDADCNDDPMLNSLKGHCRSDFRCDCGNGVKNPLTGKCK